MSKFVQAGFLMSFLVFVSLDFELGRTWLAGGVDRQSHMALIFVKQYLRKHNTSEVETLRVGRVWCEVDAAPIFGLEI